MYDKIEVGYGAPPDREKEVCSIMCDRKIFVELDQERNELAIGFYQRQDREPWRFELNELIDLLEWSKDGYLDTGE